MATGQGYLPPPAPWNSEKVPPEASKHGIQSNWQETTSHHFPIKYTSLFLALLGCNSLVYVLASSFIPADCVTGTANRPRGTRTDNSKSKAAMQKQSQAAIQHIFGKNETLGKEVENPAPAAASWKENPEELQANQEEQQTCRSQTKVRNQHRKLALSYDTTPKE